MAMAMHASGLFEFNYWVNFFGLTSTSINVCYAHSNVEMIKKNVFRL